MLRACLPIAGLVLSGCAAPDPAPIPGSGGLAAEQSILARASPAPGGMVPAPVDQLEFWFEPPARLSEVTVTGADGLMSPIMITPVGESRYYSVPVSGLEKGSYTVSWRATVGGRSYQGSYRFAAT